MKTSLDGNIYAFLERLEVAKGKKLPPQEIIFITEKCAVIRVTTENGVEIERVTLSHNGPCDCCCHDTGAMYHLFHCCSHSGVLRADAIRTALRNCRSRPTVIVGGKS